MKGPAHGAKLQLSMSQHQRLWRVACILAAACFLLALPAHGATDLYLQNGRAVVLANGTTVSYEQAQDIQINTQYIGEAILGM